MQVIAFAGFVVVAQNAYAIDDEREPILVVVLAAAHGLRDTPNHDFSEDRLGQLLAIVSQRALGMC